jgi:hypothetical protein
MSLFRFHSALSGSASILRQRMRRGDVCECLPQPTQGRVIGGRHGGAAGRPALERQAEHRHDSWPRGCMQVSPSVVQPLGSFPAFYGTRRFIAALTRAVPILSQTNPVHTSLFYLYKIHVNAFHPLTSWSFCWSLSLWLSYQ